MTVFADFCPWASDAGVRLYLRPLGLGPVGEAGAGEALPLAGGRFVFAGVEVIVRRPGLTARRAGRLAEAEDWAALSGADVAAAFAARLAALTRPRPPFAGLSLDRPRLMGILNVTPDSFSDGGDFVEPAHAVARGRALFAAGADLVDVGGESTRPGAAPVTPEAEIARIAPVVRALAGEGGVVSLDTRRAAVMRAGLAAGARAINDVSGLSGEPESLGVVAAAGAPVILMHMQGEPATMQDAPVYDDVSLDVFDWLEARLDRARAAGIAMGDLAVDPGIGFGKTLAHNLQLLRQTALFHGLGAALAIGVSRKSFIGRLAGAPEPKARLSGSLAAGLKALDQGAQILRVHDVVETAQARAVWEALNPER